MACVSRDPAAAAAEAPNPNCYLFQRPEPPELAAAELLHLPPAEHSPQRAAAPRAPNNPEAARDYHWNPACSADLAERPPEQNARSRTEEW